jgi:hypothetical protein
MESDKLGIVEDYGLSTRDSCGYCKGKAGDSVSHGKYQASCFLLPNPGLPRSRLNLLVLFAQACGLSR